MSKKGVTQAGREDGRGARRAPAKPRARGAPAPVQPELAPKQRPVQRRAVDTFDQILTVAAELLAEVGIERLSTNLICARAGLTPPALYRYFPNKYAVLTELATRLMDRQDEVVFDWLKRDLTTEPVTMAANLRDLFLAQCAVTLDQPGSAWVLRALRAVPALEPVRVLSGTRVAEAAFTRIAPLFPKADPADLALALRLSTQLMYSLTELVVQEPDQDVNRIATEVADMVGRYYLKFL